MISLNSQNIFVIMTVLVNLYQKKKKNPESLTVSSGELIWDDWGATPTLVVISNFAIVHRLFGLEDCKSLLS